MCVSEIKCVRVLVSFEREREREIVCVGMQGLTTSALYGVVSHRECPDVLGQRTLRCGFAP